MSKTPCCGSLFRFLSPKGGLQSEQVVDTATATEECVEKAIGKTLDRVDEVPVLLLSSLLS